MAISINWATKVITVPKADTTLVQSVPTEIRNLDINTFRLALKDLEDNEAGISWPDTHRHNTEVTIGGVTLSRVVEIINGYTVTFEDGQWAVNLINANSNIGDNVNVNQVSVRSANSAGLVNIKEIGETAEATKQLIEGLRPHHSGTGHIYYWDPVNGLNTNDGLSPDKACATFAYIHDNLVEDYHHDVVIAYAGNPTGTTVTTENLVITKNYVFLRGPGRDFLIQSSNTLLDFVKITGSGVQIEKVRIGNDATNTKHAVWSSGNFTSLNQIIVNDCNKGIELFGGEHSSIVSCDIQDNLSYGIKIAGSASRVNIKDCHMGDNGGTGVLIDNVGGTDVSIFNGNIIHGNGGYGVDITAGTSDVLIQGSVNLYDNTLGNVRDLGTGNRNEIKELLTEDNFLALK